MRVHKKSLSCEGVPKLQMVPETMTHKQSPSNSCVCSPEEWKNRQKLAGAYRILDHLGWTETIYGHITLRVPGPETHFLINPYGLRYDEVTASNLVKIDLDGNILDRSNHRVNRPGFVIHSAIHSARHDAHCVLHTHTVAGMAVAAQRDGLLPISMPATGFHGRIAYHDFEGPSLKLGERERLIKNLGNRNIMILRTHGLLTCGKELEEAFILMFRLQRACEIQIAAQGSGVELVVPPKQVCEQSAELTDNFLSDNDSQETGKLEFDAFLRLMDQKDPTYQR